MSLMYVPADIENDISIVVPQGLAQPMFNIRPDHDFEGWETFDDAARWTPEEGWRKP